MECVTEPTPWIEVDCPDGRRGVWVRTDRGAVELAGGCDGDGDYVALRPGEAPNASTLAALRMVLRDFVYSSELGAPHVTSLRVRRLATRVILDGLTPISETDDRLRLMIMSVETAMGGLRLTVRSDAWSLVARAAPVLERFPSGLHDPSPTLDAVAEAFVAEGWESS